MRWSLARTLTVGYLTVIAGGACAELAARAVDKIRYGVAWSAAPDFGIDLVVRDTLGTRGRPNGRYQKWQLNSAGFRSPESVLTPKPGCTRVMTLGSSESFGYAESPGKEYAAQLGDSLARHGCYQVMNAAIVGVSVPGIIDIWNRWASRFSPDIVVILANPLSYLADEPPAFAPPAFAPPRTRNESNQRPWWTPRVIGMAKDVVQFPDAIQRRRVRRALEQLTSGHEPGWLFTSMPVERLELYRAHVDSLLATIRSHGARPVLTTYPIRFGAVLDPADQLVLDGQRMFSPRAEAELMLAFATASADASRDLGRQRGAPVVDLERAIRGRRELFADAVHYTDIGAAIVAGEIARGINDATSTNPQRSRPTPSALRN